MISRFAWEDVTAEKLLEEQFHISTGFYAGQHEIIERLVQGKQRVLAIQHTGWGKSLCYQMASLYYPHLTIVFSPLIALMREQCRRCNDHYSIPAALVCSDCSQEENTMALRKAVAKEIKILFIAPERLSNQDWQEHVQHMNISMVVIDEAHCISTWGHDFRPAYRRIAHLLNALPVNTPVLALTATANQQVEMDILQQVGPATKIIRGTMRRPNLHLNVVSLHGDHEKLCYLATLLPQLCGTGIIYAASRSTVEMIAMFLQSQGITSQFYHAGRNPDQKKETEQELQNNQYKVVCSTNALGMGMDKPDLRFVIHYNFPASPIHYYQEIGRAGRDGENAACILLYDEDDLKIQEHFILNAKPASQYYRVVLRYIQRATGRGVKQKDILLDTRVSSTTMLKTILTELQEQNLIEKKRDYYTSSLQFTPLDFSINDVIQQQKLRELQAIIQYAQARTCYTVYLTNYLGDTADNACGDCGRCAPTSFPPISPSTHTRQLVTKFLAEDFLPRIEATSQYEPGWSLSYHGNSDIGQLVRLSKYYDAGPFTAELVQRAVEVLQKLYPLDKIDGIASIPPTKSGKLVETFAQNVADMLSITYVLTLEKTRKTSAQKDLVNRKQKEQNVKDAFAVPMPEVVSGRTFLLIDDIYDSGHTLRAAAKVLLEAGALAIYPLTITRTLHSDDQ